MEIHLDIFRIVLLKPEKSFKANLSVVLIWKEAALLRSGG